MKIIKLIPVLLMMASCATTKKMNNIEKVDFRTSPCFGTCPVFNMSIDKDGVAVFDAKRFNDVTGEHKGTIKKEQLDSLFTMINKAEIMSLEDKYTVQITDMPGYLLSVKFTDGQTKTISDYGPSGPEPLKKIYNFIESLRGSQEWKKQ